MGVLHTPSRHTFECDGTQRVFPIPSLIISQDFVRIEIDGVLQSDRKQWDIVSNSLVFVEAPINGAILDVQVASDSESLGELGMIANVDILAKNINNVNKAANIDTDVTKVADIDLDVVTVAGIVSEIPIVSAISTDVTTVASISSDVITVANIESDVTKVSNIDLDVTTVANNIVDVQNAEENALTAKEEAWKAEADRLTAKSYATEPENVFVKIYTSNNDGTFNVTDTTDYSSHHWEIKASTLVTTGVIDDVTSSAYRTYSSNKIDGIVSTINNNITTIVTDNITPIENNIDTIEGNVSTLQGNVSTLNSNVSTLNNTTVKLTDNQTVAGVKTFTSSPIVPTPTIDFQAATKKYVDGMGSNGLGVGQTWLNVTSSRTTGVTYTNTTGKPIQVFIAYYDGGNKATFTINGIDINYTTTSTYRQSMSYSFIVPNNCTYKFNGTSVVTAGIWLELRGE